MAGQDFASGGADVQHRLSGANVCKDGGASDQGELGAIASQATLLLCSLYEHKKRPQCLIHPFKQIRLWSPTKVFAS